VTKLLGIETSCDETSAAVLTGSGNSVTLDALVILSQDVHRIFGGVVPELASRAHLTSIAPVVDRACADARTTLDDIDAIGVTYAPGLVGALLVGVSYAKAAAFARGIPVVAVHHLEGHLFAQSLEHRDAVPPFTALLVSGGHTLLIDVEAWGQYRLLGRTRDDAAGEAFDKVAKLLGLPYPGGPHLERLARKGDSSRVKFTRPMLHSGQREGDADYYDVSFSGLKTAVRRAVLDAGPSIEEMPPHIARGFQDAIVDTLVEKTARAARAYRRDRIVLGGGVACNQALVTAMQARAGQFGARVFAPSPRLATDNAAMIARAALFRLERGDVAAMDLNAYASRDIPGLLK
jgi:N6-L-threonylcarbamoyladenine synthase